MKALKGENSNTPGTSQVRILSHKSLKRRIASGFRNQNHTFFAIVPPGTESLAKQEIRERISPESIIVETGGIQFSGPLNMGFTANLLLEIPVRILIRFSEFHCLSYPELLNRTFRLTWEFFLGLDPIFEFRVSSEKSRLHHTSNIENTIRKGIEHRYNSFRIEEKKETTSNKNPVRIYARFFQDVLTLSVDLSGNPLYMRGYKKQTGKAPLRENLAASILKTVSLEQYSIICDPFCGSGTLILEASRIVSEIPPGVSRRFAFEQMPFAKGNELQDTIKGKKEIHNQNATSNKGPRCEMLGMDLSQKTIAMARENLKTFQEQYEMDGFFPDPSNIHFLCENAFQLHRVEQVQSLIQSKGLIVSNLPYGKRVSAKDSTEKQTSNEWIQEFLDYLANFFPNWDVLFLVDAKEARKSPIVLKNPAMKFQNGGISVHLYSIKRPAKTMSHEE